MHINDYKILISNLPVRQQCFTTRRTTWSYAEKRIVWLKKLNTKLFHGQETLTISRQDIFKTKYPREKIIKTIYWGYRGGMRGKNFVKILKNIGKIKKSLQTLRGNVRETTLDSEELKSILHNIPGLGLSTYSKLLYFFEIEINNNPCLILDQRLIDVFKNNTFDEFNQISDIRYRNAEKRYLKYLELTQQLAGKIKTKGEHIEQFLFIFGNNLRPNE